MGGILRELHVTPIMVGDTNDHVHLLIKPPADLAISDCLRGLKTNSSRWVKEKWPEHRTFGWQCGYGAFSVSESSRQDVICYIQNQVEHHHRMTFQEEFLSFLKKHGIESDKRYIWR
jgi:REP element-mobilizing transposase RayT